MGSGGGGFIENVIKDVAVPVATLGLVGFDEEGNIGAGVVPQAAFQAVDETIGEVTGRNLYREQMAIANDRVREEELKREQNLSDEQKRAAIRDRQASNYGSLVRNNAFSSQTRTNLASALRANSLNNSSGDFLGL